MSRKAAKKKITCRHFMQGTCKKTADKCAFKHPEGETSTSPPAAPVAPEAEASVAPPAGDVDMAEGLSDADLQDAGLA